MTVCCGSEVTCVGSVFLPMCFKYKQGCLKEDKSESDLLFPEASSTGEAGEERFVSPLVCRERPGRTKTTVITVNLRKGSMAAKLPTNRPGFRAVHTKGEESSKWEGSAERPVPIT
ncbi:hypothetical protein NQZ68_017005 [Dissostichus eleginoides]|nr:hypothetical protein NQZ68_017005 [Dissostichus eleginoides]